MANYTFERTDPGAFRLTFEAEMGEDCWVLLMSDEHQDNAHCDRALLLKHHREAVERGAPVLKLGDTFCAMQGKWDKRADQNELRPEHRGNNYLDKLVSTAAELYSPFAPSIVLLADGNHEASISLRHQTDLTERLAERLRAAGATLETAPIQGFVRLTVRTPRKTLGKTLCYHHGYGGGGEVTRGMIDNNRTRGQYDADVFYSGHIHRANQDENVIEYLSQAGTVERKVQHFLRGGAYKDDDKTSWHRGRGASARPKGGWWLRLRMVREANGSDVLELDPQRAR